MAELLQGANLLLFFRELAKRTVEDGSKLRFQTEHSISKSKETETTMTKDGPMSTISDGETTIEVSSIAYVDDIETMTTWEKLEDCFDRKALMEVWEVDITKVTPEQLAVKPTYRQGYFSDFEKSAPADGKVELNYSMVINGNGVKGEDALTAEQLKAVKAAAYEYQKIAKATKETETGM